MSATARRRKPLTERPIYLVVRRLADPDTGELIGALVPRTPVDQRTMKERNFRMNTQLKGNLRQARNYKFYGLAHILGGWLADNVEGFEGHTQHSALKKLQELSGIGCDEESFTMDLGAQLGTVTGTRKVARSLNFEDMDEGEFAELWDGGDAANHEGGWLGWLRREKWGALSSEQVEWIESVITRDGAT